MDANTPDSTNKLELKNTVRLPKTDFPMKANLGNLETRLLAHWQETNIYERTRERKGQRHLADISRLMPLVTIAVVLLAFMFLTGFYLDTFKG